MKTEITEIFSEQYFQRNANNYLQSIWIEQINIFWSNEIENGNTEFVLTSKHSINILEQKKFKDLCKATNLSLKELKERIYLSTRISIQ